MGIGNTKLDVLLNKGRVLSEAKAWTDSFNRVTKEHILDWIKEDQLRKKGVSADDEVIGYYSYVTSLINPEKKFNTPFTLYDTGEFYRSIFVTVLSDRLEIDANTAKMEDKNWFTTRIYNLNEENLAKLVQEIKGKYIDYVKRLLFGP